MRFDTPVYFIKAGESEYDATTGNYSEPEPVETKVYASVCDTGIETLKLIYGSLLQGSLTICLQVHYSAPFDHIRVGSKRYNVDFQRRLKNKHTFIVSEAK